MTRHDWDGGRSKVERAMGDTVGAASAGLTVDRLTTVEPLDSLMGVTLQAATSPRHVRCRQCRGIGNGERDVLAALCLSQRGWELDLRRELSSWLAPSAGRLIARLMGELGSVLRGQGMVVPVREIYVPIGHGLPSRQPDAPMPGPASVH